jgi:2,4-dienoyl-CoA reductase (NADPH2)
LQAGRHRLRNRVVMGSMHTRFELLGDAIERQAAFYAARARGGAALIITGGFAPNAEARIDEDAPVLDTLAQARELRPVTQAVHEHGGKILLQVLHTGRYAKVPQPVGASTIPSRINPRVPRRLSGPEIEATIEDFARCAALAREAGFDGVEVMGSEGYLLNQFAVTRTNDRDDDWGGSVANRHRLAVEVVRRVRERMGADGLLMYRLSAIDLVEGGAPADEIVALARSVEAAGADIINTGIGWHEARVPTIAYVVPRGAYRFAAARVQRAVAVPVVASNRINTPELAEDIIASGDAALVSMARPFLADPDFVRKAAAGQSDRINTCIACNQACLDYIFSDRAATCLVNPQAGREFDFARMPAPAASRSVAVVGAGAAGMACAIAAAERGHHVTLFEAAPVLGGQLNWARAVPGKDEFGELLRYFRRQLDIRGVTQRLGQAADVEALTGFDRVVIATGVRPRVPDMAGIDHPSVISYPDLLSGRRKAGRRVAVVGAGGIGFDVAEYLLHEGAAVVDEVAAFQHEWGVDPAPESVGGLRTEAPGAAATRGHGAAAQARQARPHAGPVHRLGAEGPSGAPAGEMADGLPVPAHRRRRPARQRQRPAAGAGGRQHRAVCRPGTRAQPVRPPAGRGHRSRRDRRCRQGRGTGRAARHRPGHAPGLEFVEPPPRSACGASPQGAAPADRQSRIRGAHLIATARLTRTRTLGWTASCRRPPMDYADFQFLTFEHRDNGVLVITINRPEVMNATNARLHWELTKIWGVVQDDDRTKVAIITGAGDRAFSAGGDLDWVSQMVGNPKQINVVMKEAADIVYNMMACEKVIISAINGVAVGAGLAVAILADISIMAETARITDGHVKLGVGAGDHATIVWPLLCGMAKAKYYLLTADFIDGKEAERIGLVSLTCPADELMARALKVADKLAAGSQQAIRVTKMSLNNWMQVARPIFDQSLALEMLCFLGEDAPHGVTAVREKRAPVFPSAQR